MDVEGPPVGLPRISTELNRDGELDGGVIPADDFDNLNVPPGKDGLNDRAVDVFDLEESVCRMAILGFEENEGLFFPPREE
jgi:hypothetical protein